MSKDLQTAMDALYERYKILKAELDRLLDENRALKEHLKTAKSERNGNMRLLLAVLDALRERGIDTEALMKEVLS